MNPYFAFSYVVCIQSRPLREYFEIDFQKVAGNDRY